MLGIIDKGVINKDINYIIFEGFLMFRATILDALFTIIRSIISTKISQSFDYDFGNNFFRKIN